MLIDIDSEEFEKAETNHEKEQAISYVMNIESILPTNLPPHRYAVAAYFLLKAKYLSPAENLKRPLFSENKENQSEKPLFTTADIDSDIIEIGKKYITDEIWEKLLYASKIASPSILENTIILAPRPTTLNNESITPPTLIELGKKLLNIKNSEKVADFCCGTGQFIVSAAQEIPDSDYTGFELDPEKYAIAKLKSEALNKLNGTKAEIFKRDIFRNYLNNQDVKYNKIFANYPFAEHFLNEEGRKNVQEYIEEKLKKEDKIFETKISSDWLFNKLIFDSLSENGKAVAIMASGSAVNTSDAGIREYFVKNNMIEAVITLPEKLFTETAMSTSIIILGHNKKNTIRIINCSTIFTSGRRLNYLSEENIKKIKELLDSPEPDITYAQDFTKENLKENGYQLKLSDNIERKPPLFPKGGKNIKYIPLSEILNSPITRGAQFDASELDKMAELPEESKNVAYLQLKDIQNGIISNDLTKINIEVIQSERTAKKIKYENYLIKNNNIVLSKNGEPFKVAFVPVPENEKVLANGNLYIIDIDESKGIKSKYVAAYLGSNQGQLALDSIATGSKIKTIGIKKLEQLEIPCVMEDKDNKTMSKPDEKQQVEVIKKFIDRQKKIRNYKKLLDEAYKDLGHLFDAPEDFQ